MPSESVFSSRCARKPGTCCGSHPSLILRVTTVRCAQGHPGEPLPPNQIAKKKIWEAVQPELGTDAQCIALYGRLPFGTQHGPCTVATIKNGKIK